MLSLRTSLKKAIAAAGFLLLLAACGGGAATSPLQQPAATSPMDLEATLATASELVPGIRQLDFLSEVQPNYLSARELTDYIQQKLDQEDREELQRLQELYRTLELIDQELELYPLYLDLLREQVVGVFDPETEELFVLQGGTQAGVAEELTLAHELTHALQQQHFDIHALQEEAEASGNIDRELALSSLVEGDAVLSEFLYQQARSLPLPDIPDSPLLDSAPPIVQDTFILPYLDGPQFVVQLWRPDRSWSPVNAAYRRPPQSTEQILHPDRYLAGDAPLEVVIPDLLPALGGDWELIFSSVAGEFLLKSYLDSNLSESDAASAAAGWGGDRFLLYRNSVGQKTLVLLTRWDTTEDARQFFDAYEQFTDEADGWQTRAEDAGWVRWGRPGRQVHLELAGDEVTVILAPAEGELERLLPLLSGS